MRIIICDDEEYIREQLKDYLCEYFESNGLKLPEIDCYACQSVNITNPAEK